MISIGRALASLRKRKRHKCETCEKSFVAIKTAKFCSNACRQKAKYRRNSKKSTGTGDLNG